MSASDPHPVLVTGATGNVGRHVLAALRARGVPVRAAVTSVDAARPLLGDDVEYARLDFFDRSTWPAALQGARGLFLLRPPAIAKVQTTLNPLIDEARKAGVEHVTFLSVTGAEKNSLIPHHKVEQHLVHGTFAYTLLRPGFFAQNVGDQYRRDVCEDQRLYVPAGAGRVAFVDCRDLGEVAAQSFVDPALKNRAVTLTGPETFSFQDVARVLSETLGRPIRYEPASVPGYFRHLRRRGMPFGQCAVLVILHVGLRRGDADQVDPTLGELLGRRPRSLVDYVRDHAHLWRLAQVAA